MDDQEILRRKQEAQILRKQVGDFEYRKIKAARRREYYEQTRRMLESRSGILEAKPEELAQNLLEHSMTLPPEVKRPKKRGCFVQVMVVDERGEYTHIWNAPQLMGTVYPGKQTKEGYMELIKPGLEKALGKLQDREK